MRYIYWRSRAPQNVEGLKLKKEEQMRPGEVIS